MVRNAYQFARSKIFGLLRTAGLEIKFIVLFLSFYLDFRGRPSEAMAVTSRYVATGSTSQQAA